MLFENAGAEGQMVRLIAIPRFCETGIAVMVICFYFNSPFNIVAAMVISFLLQFTFTQHLYCHVATYSLLLTCNFAGLGQRLKSCWLVIKRITNSDIYVNISLVITFRPLPITQYFLFFLVWFFSFG